MKLNTYEIHLNELLDRADTLRGRINRFSAHPTLHTRVDGVKAELAKVETAIPKARATAKWAREVYA